MGNWNLLQKFRSRCSLRLYRQRIRWFYSSILLWRRWFGCCENEIFGQVWHFFFLKAQLLHQIFHPSIIHRWSFLAQNCDAFSRKYEPQKTKREEMIEQGLVFIFFFFLPQFCHAAYEASAKFRHLRRRLQHPWNHLL